MHSIGEPLQVQLNFLRDYPLSKLSTFKIGGPCDYFLSVNSIEMLQEALSFARERDLPFFVIGKGSNCLFPDEGLRGLVILNKIDFLEEEGTKIHVGAGMNFSRLGAMMARKGLGGLEFASGIPGSVGGAVYMNAGANGAETQDCLTHVSYVDEKGELQEVEKGALQFRYRYSSFHKMRAVITSARFELAYEESAREKQLDIVKYRMATQPYGEASAGCIFVNPYGVSAGALIDELGLKGMKVGGAEISTLHGNFIVNKGGAKAQDVLDLAEEVKRIVKEKRGHELEMEVRFVGPLSR